MDTVNTGDTKAVIKAKAIAEVIVVITAPVILAAAMGTDTAIADMVMANEAMDMGADTDVETVTAMPGRAIIAQSIIHIPAAMAATDTIMATIQATETMAIGTATPAMAADTRPDQGMVTIMAADTGSHATRSAGAMAMAATL